MDLKAQHTRTLQSLPRRGTAIFADVVGPSCLTPNQKFLDINEIIVSKEENVLKKKSVSLANKLPSTHGGFFS